MAMHASSPPIGANQALRIVAPLLATLAVYAALEWRARTHTAHTPPPPAVAVIETAPTAPAPPSDLDPAALVGVHALPPTEQRLVLDASGHARVCTGAGAERDGTWHLEGEVLVIDTDAGTQRYDATMLLQDRTAPGGKP